MRAILQGMHALTLRISAVFFGSFTTREGDSPGEGGLECGMSAGARSEWGPGGNPGTDSPGKEGWKAIVCSLFSWLFDRGGINSLSSGPSTERTPPATALGERWGVRSWSSRDTVEAPEVGAVDPFKELPSEDPSKRLETLVDSVGGQFSHISKSTSSSGESKVEPDIIGNGWFC